MSEHLYALTCTRCGTTYPPLPLNDAMRAGATHRCEGADYHLPDDSCHKECEPQCRNN